MPIRRGRRGEGAGLEDIDPQVLQQLVDLGTTGGGVGLEERLQLAQMIRRNLGENGSALDRFFLERFASIGSSMAEIRESQAALKMLLDQYQQGAWLPAVYLSLLPDADPPRASVMVGTTRRVVGIAEGVDLESLVAGEEIYLNEEQGLVVGISSIGVPPSTDTASYERELPGARLLLRWRDEFVVAQMAAALRGEYLEAGDLVRWDRAMGVAYERVEREPDKRYVLDDVQHVSPESVGGQDDNLRELFAAVLNSLMDPDGAQRYQLGDKQSILLIGPPGTGKTLLARAVAGQVDSLSGKRCRIACVKPSEWESPWVGETQRNIRECFASLREESKDGFGILFLDEVDSIGRVRGGVGGRHDDKFLDAILAEIDGFADRKNIVIIAATNRKDLIDPALLERLSDLELLVARPNMPGARRIVEIHLPEDLPFAASTDGDRMALVDRIVSRLYAPNGAADLNVVRFRDGTSRTVAARELLSGRSLAQLCRAVRSAAFSREVAGGTKGIGARDVEDAVTSALEKLRSTLTVRNCAAYLSDLPQDVDVVAVERIARPVGRPHDYLSAA